MSTIQISVTADDIAAATTARNNQDFDATCHCPVTTALRRVYPRARVGPVQFRKSNRSLTFYPLPLTARTFIAAFDAGEAVTPIIFELEVNDAN